MASGRSPSTLISTTLAPGWPGAGSAATSIMLNASHCGAASKMSDTETERGPSPLQAPTAAATATDQRARPVSSTLASYHVAAAGLTHGAELIVVDQLYLVTVHTFA